MPSGLRSMDLPVRGGSGHLWGGLHLHAQPLEALPLLVCHGGPGVPGDYLFPLIGQLRRPVIFFRPTGMRAQRPAQP